MKNKQIKRAIDTNLACLRISERDVQNIMLQAQEGKKMKKKVSAGLVIALVLVLLAATAVGVGVMSGLNYWKAADTEVGAPLRMVTLNDEVYFITLKGFFQWNQEEAVVLTDRETLEELGIDTLDCWMFVHNDSVMLLSKQGELWKYSDGEWQLEKDYTNTETQDSFRRVRKLVCQDGYVFIDGSANGGSTSALIRFNLNDGAVDELPVHNVLRLCDYRDGKILAVIRLSEEEEQLVMIDAASGSIVSKLITMHAMAMNGLAYDAANDRIYGMVNGALSVWNGLQWHELRKVSLPGLAHSFCITDRFYLAASHEGIQSIALDETVEIEQTVLTVRGCNSAIYQLDHDFQQSHPNLTVSRQSEGYFTAEDVRKAIEAGDQTDVFHIVLDASWLELLESEMLSPIAAEELESTVGNMTKQFQNVLLKDNRLYAVPVSAIVMSWEKQRNDVPETYAELFAKPYDGLTWTGVRWSQNDYVSRLIKQQILESGERFDTPAFRQTLELLKENGLDKRSQTVMNTSNGFSFANMRDMRNCTAPLKIDSNADAVYPVSLYCYVLNPHAQNHQAALEYLQYAFEKTSPETQAVLAPDHVQPTLLPAAELWIENVKRQHALDVKEGLLPDDPAALEERLQIIRDMPGNQLVTRKQLEQYKEKIEPYLDLRLHPLLSYQYQSIVEAMSDEIIRFLNGEISLDDAIMSLSLLATNR